MHSVAKFIWEEIVCRHGLFGRLVVDGGKENAGAVQELTTRYGIHRVQASAYHPQANPVERGHRPLKDSLSKLATHGHGNWVDNLHAVLWADRTVVRTTTGMSAFRLNYGYDPILPVEEEVPTWSFVRWEDCENLEDLVALRALQLARRDKDLLEAADRLRRKREQGKEQFDATHVIREEPLQKGDLVLLHNTEKERDMSNVQKAHFKWLGPYRISDTSYSDNRTDRGFYEIKELDGTKLKNSIAGNRLKRWWKLTPPDLDFTLARRAP